MELVPYMNDEKEKDYLNKSIIFLQNKRNPEEHRDKGDDIFHYQKNTFSQDLLLDLSVNNNSFNKTKEKLISCPVKKEPLSTAKTYFSTLPELSNKMPKIDEHININEFDNFEKFDNIIELNEEENIQGKNNDDNLDMMNINSNSSSLIKKDKKPKSNINENLYCQALDLLNLSIYTFHIKRLVIWVR